MKVVVATHNPGKLRELEAILAPELELVSQAALGIPETEEPHDTFVENALAKARHASRLARLPALADDSGLCVPALGGEPGVHSAYYAGRQGERDVRDARNNARLLASLSDRRSAYYCCLLVLVRRADDPRPLVAEGLWHGEIARAPRGTGGFGYDPLFLVAGTGKTAAELSPAEKNRISHRALAARRLLELLHADDRG
ncbi:MAG TPA: RdgB/HAM1 family non-canonical purine NTP pyrophosphatase [Burkholderiales bacterium]|nr:RdgB/HAM1 family non-canonical purine NTP pyrophosphatase [Burkholderiales bacterium]